MDFRMQLLRIIIRIPAVLIAFTVQGYGRAFMADKLGDKTPRFQGRLTLNPAAHIDPIGFILILFAGFGWTKPLDTNPSAYKRGYKDSIKVAVAGPLANLIVAFLGAILYVLSWKLAGVIPDTMYVILSSMLSAVVSVNASLFIFNLLPLPGLAGFDIFRSLWPKTFYKVSDSIYRYQFLIFIAIILIGGTILSIPVGWICNLCLMIAKILVGWI